MKTRFYFLLILVLLVCAAWPGRADAAGITIPPGFKLLQEAPGVQLYRKNYPNGAPDFVQVINLGQGAVVRPLAAPVAGPGTSKGVYGGDNPKFDRQSLQKFWNSLSRGAAAPFCVTNGQFFYMPEYPGPLPFPLKIDGQILTDGYGINDFPGNKLMLELWPGRANIRELSQEALYGSDAPDIIAGLTEEANKRAKQAVGRTFTGVADGDGDGTYEIVLIFNTQLAKQVDAAEVLRDFGAAQVMMLDGGGSTQLQCGDQSYIYSERLIPQALGVLAAGGEAGRAAVAPAAAVQAATPEPVTAAILRHPYWPVVVTGETYSSEIQVQNTGPAAWQPGDVQVVVTREGLPSDTLPLTVTLPPGTTGVFTWTTSLAGLEGVIPAQIHLESGGQAAAKSTNFAMIVLPESLASRREDLLVHIENWVQEDPQAVPGLAADWIQKQEALLVQAQAEVQSAGGPVGIAAAGPQSPKAGGPGAATSLQAAKTQVTSAQIAAPLFAPTAGDLLWAPATAGIISLLIGVTLRRRRREGWET